MLLNQVNEGDVISKKGIFQYLADKQDLNAIIGDGRLMDIEYMMNHSGDKTITPMFNKLIEHYNDIETVYSKLADIIYINFADKWKRLYDAYVLQNYEPLENYRMVEEEKQNTKVKTSSNQNTKTYGFNSSTPIPENTGDSEQMIEGNADDNKRTLTRSGNIGVTTSQQMLESELNLRKYNLNATIYLDVDSILTLPIYDN